MQKRGQAVISHKKAAVRKIVVIAFCAILFSMLAADISGDYRTAGFDTSVYNVVHRLYSGFATGFFKLMTNMVHPVVLFGISMAMIHVLKQNKLLVALFGNLVLTVLLNLAIKGSFMRVRPPEELRLVMETGYSFPSGHAMVAASFYGFLIFMLFQASMSKKRRAAGTVACLLAVLFVGCSRIYLGVHYATDVLGGFLVSAVYLVVYTWIVSLYFQAEMPGLKPGRFSPRQRMILSFKHALDGIIGGLKNEPNMMIHYSAVVLVIVFGITLRLSVTEWCICLILCGLVIALELVNTAIEAAVDLVTLQYDERAKLAKDTAAGAVLVAAIAAAVVGGLIFVPKIILLFS